MCRRNYMNKLLLGTLLLGTAALGFCDTPPADEIIGKLESIYRISDDGNRLESYDQLAASLGITKTTGAAGETGDVDSKWEVSVQTDQMDDSKKIFFMLPAESATAYDRVALFIRYQNGKTELFVAWGDYLGDNSRVTVRFGNEDPYTEYWSKSSDSTATFCRNPVSFIQKIADYDRLVMRITPYSEGPKTAVFDIRGLKEEVEPYNDDLEWF
jgi:type VI secretion system protein VasI